MRLLLVAIWVPLQCSTALGADQMWTELRAGEEAQTRAYSRCSPDECFGEGITHILGCSSAGGGFFIITTSDRNLEIVEAIAALEASTPGVKP
jgi:hypothetical protein